MEDRPGSDNLKGEATRLLSRMRDGDSRAGGELFELLYPELRSAAEAHMRGQAGSHTLQATALVNEAFLRLSKGQEQTFENRRHFLLTASRAMRHVLVDHARGKQRLKRSAKRTDAPLDQVVLEGEGTDFDLEALDLALQELERRDPPMAKAVELRFFGGVGTVETARVLGMAPRTFDRRWQTVRAWLAERMAS